MSVLIEKSKMLPHAEELEIAVLSAIQIDKTAMALIRDTLTDEMFYRTKHQEIYKAACWLYDRQHPIDMLHLGEELKRRDMLEKVGGYPELVEISRKVTTTANVEYDARIIAEMYLKRQVIYACDDFATMTYRNSVDVFEVLGKMGDKLNELNGVASGGTISHIGDIGDKIVEQITESMENGGEQPGAIYTGLPELDERLGGMQPGDFGIIAARPAMGKTTLAQQVARKGAISQRKAVALFSLEMTESQIGGGMICAEAGINKDRLREYSKFTPTELARFKKEKDRFHEYPIYISDKGGATINQIRAGVKSAKMQAQKDGNKLGLVIIDYLQLMGSLSKYGTREQEVSNISKALKQMAKDENVPVVALSQLSRAVEIRGGDKRPQLSDLRESGSLEQDADWVLFLYRPEYYKIIEDEQGNSLKGITEIIVGKNRHGEVEDVLCTLDLRTGIFTSKDDFDLLPEPSDDAAPYGAIAAGTVSLNDDENIPF